MPTPQFKLGDRVRRINRSWGNVHPGDEGTVSGQDSTTLYLKEHGNMGFSAEYFELVSSTNHVDLKLQGEILSRTADAATIKLASGETIVVPASLVPIDPDLIKLRKLFADYHRPRTQHTAVRFETGERDDKLRVILPSFKELINAS